MSLFEKIFGNKKEEPKGEYHGEFRMLNGYVPHFTTWGGSVYESELVRAAINAIATHCSKLNVELFGAAKPKLQTKLKHAPNEFQTWSAFLYRLATILYCCNNAVLCPILDKYGEISGIYCVLPERCTIVQYGDVPYLRYEFSNGQRAAIELEYCGIMTRFQFKDDFFGESNYALNPTMQLIHMTNQGIEEGVKSAATFRFMAQISNFSKHDDIKKEQQRFSMENFAAENSSPLLLFPNTYTNIKQIDSKPFVIDADQMKLINQSIYNYFGVNEAVLTNAAYGDAWSAFYEGCIEHFAIQASQTLTKMLYTYREQTEGNHVMLTANRLQYMSNADKLAVSAQMLDRGIMSINEIRDIWNLPHVPEGDTRLVRGEYYTTTEKVENNDGENDT